MTSQYALELTIVDHIRDEIIAFGRKALLLWGGEQLFPNLTEQVEEIETQMEDLLGMLTPTEQKDLKNDLANDFRSGDAEALEILEVIDEEFARTARQKQQRKPKELRRKGPYNQMFYLAYTPNNRMGVKFTGLNKELAEKLHTAHMDGNLRSFTDIPETADEFLDIFRGFDFAKEDAANIVRKAQGMKRSLKLYDLRTLEQDLYSPAIPDYR